MPTFINFTVVNGTANQELFTVTDQLSGQNLMTDQPMAPNDPPIPLQANPDPSGRGLITYGFRGGVPTVNYSVSDGDQVSMQ
jgi:hypothetical protein